MMPLGMDVGLGPDDTALDADPCSSPPKRAQPPTLYGACMTVITKRLERYYAT